MPYVACNFLLNYRYGTVSLNILDKHYQNTEATLLQNNEHLFRTFFFTYYPAVDEEKTNRRSQIQIYGSEYNTDIYRWWNVQRVTFIYP